MLLGPDLDLGAPAAGEVAVLEVDVADRALVARQVEHARARALLEELLDLGVPRRALGELDLEVDELEITVEHDQRELGELALAAADRDAIVIDPAVDLALAEHDPALRVPGERCRPDRGAAARGLPAPDLDARASAT